MAGADINEKRDRGIDSPVEVSKLRELSKLTNDILYLIDTKGVLRYVSPQIENLGIKPGELTSRPFIHAIHPDDRDRVIEDFRNHIEKKREFVSELRVTGGGGKVYWLESLGKLSYDAGGKVAGLSGILRNITKRKEAEAALRESENRYRVLFESANDAIVIIKGDRYVDCNRRACELFGYSREEFENAQLGHLSPPRQPDGKSSREGLKKKLQAAMKSGPQFFSWKCRRKDGTVFDVEVTFNKLVAGDEVLVQALIRDISDLVASEGWMRLQSAALNAAANAVVISDRQGKIVWTNPAFSKTTGYSPEEAIGQNPRILKSGAHGKKFYKKLWSTILAGKVWAGEIVNRRKDGKNYTEEMTITPVPNERGEVTHFIAIKQDITEKKALEEQFLRAQRLEGIGTLAGGIAHDLNNILAPIVMSAGLLRSAGDKEIRAKYLEVIEHSAKRAAAIVTQVLTFARGIEGERAILQPRHLMREMIKVARETFPPNIRIVESIPKDLWAIPGDPGQLHQVLLNLCVNARDAMKGGGELEISAENWNVDEHYAAMNPDAQRPGPFVKIQVSDTGQGIEPEILGKIFDPFFTTKEQGEGTGLGLSTLMGIVKSHEGFVTVESTPGEGAEFSVFLPASPESEPSAERRRKTVEPEEGNGELILVVDDETPICLTTKVTLEAHGYRALTAHDGTEALALYAEHRKEIRMVLTDLVMPYMDGIALIRALRKMNPSVEIVISTGQSQLKHKAELDSLGVNTILTKPYTANRLLGILAGILRQQNARK